MEIRSSDYEDFKVLLSGRVSKGDLATLATYVYAIYLSDGVSGDYVAAVIRAARVNAAKTTGETWSPGQLVYYDVSEEEVTTTAAGNILIGTAVEPATSAATEGILNFDGLLNYIATMPGETSLAGLPFRKTVTLTAAAAGTPVEIVADTSVTGSNKIFITGLLVSVGGTTAWTDATATIVTIQDTADTPVVAVTIAKAQLTSQAQLGMLSTGVTLGTTVRTGVGLTAAKGLVVTGDANFTAGSDLSVTVFGYIAAA